MTYKDYINTASNETATAMQAKGFHEDEEFMDWISNYCIDNESIWLDKLSPNLRQFIEEHGVQVAFDKIWNRNRKLARIALIHSELSEMVEGIRKDSQDDKLPHRKMEEVELADTLIRMEDYAGTYGLDLGGAREEKEAYNLSRPFKHGKLV